MNIKAYLEITMVIEEGKRGQAAQVYGEYREPFLEQIDGALSKELLIREEDVQVLHGFASLKQAQAYLESDLFIKDVAARLQPLWSAAPCIRIYGVA